MSRCVIVTGFLFMTFQVFLKMLKYVLFAFMFFICIAGCKQKEKKNETPRKYIPALPIIQGEVAHVDTSLYSIMRIDYKDSLHSDTTYIRREDFKAEAKDFLDIPDLDDQKVARRYKQSIFHDATINKVVITYTPEDPATEEIQKQELLITPGSIGDKVSTIIIIRSIVNRDSSVQKNMLWQMGKYFQVTTIRQLPGQPQTTSTTRVTWNEDNYQ
jgi:hypothetical protein